MVILHSLKLVGTKALFLLDFIYAHNGVKPHGEVLLFG